MKTWLQYFAFDVIGEISFNKKLGFLEKGEDIDGIIGTIHMMVGIAIRSAHIPPLHKFLLGNPFLRFIPAVESINTILKFTLKVVESRTSIARKGDLVLDEEGGRDQLSRWIAVNAKDPTQLSTEHIITHITANVMAGSDTTAIIFRTIFYYLLRHPWVMEKLVREIDHANEASLLGSIVSYKEAMTHLPYLRAVIKEGMRIHPSVAMMFPRVVPAGGVEICGTYLPANTIVGMNPWVVQHDPKVFPDPYMFIPERWIENSQDRLKEMEASMFVFGAGSRICIGKSIALVEIYKLVPEILRRYTITLAHPEKDWAVTGCWYV